MKNKVINFIDVYSNNINLSSNISYTHNKIAKLSNDINSLYGEISISEDITINKILSTFNTLKSITSNNKSNLIIESFLSNGYFDSSYPITNPLNIDTQNGDLTLPIDSTVNIPIDNIIIENDSNGEISNDSSIETLVNGNSSSVFKYIKVSNIYSLSDLYFSVTLETKNIDIINGIYIQLYIDNNTDYANIDEVECSIDGKVWTKVNYTYSIKKADHYIRFDPVETKLIRIKFSQSTYSSTQTGFGIRYNYIIGIRQIVIKKTKYKNTGKYISIPFSGNKLISSVLFECIDNNNTNYYISANNGSKLVEVKNGELLQLQNEKMGLRNDTIIDSIRVSILMNKDQIGLNNKYTKEYTLLNQYGKYFTKNKPKDISISIGKHISYGDLSPYIINTSKLEASTTIFDTSDNIVGMITLNYIPYYIGIVNDLVFKMNGIKIKNDRNIYDIIKHSDSNNSILVVKNTDLINNPGSLTVQYKEITSSNQIITLPARAFILSKDDFIIMINNIKLKNTEYDIIDDGINTSIHILNNSYSKDNIYTISYYPSVSIGYSSIDGNEINIGATYYTQGSQVCFEYIYDSGELNYLIDYYTPICKEYKVQLQ